MSPGQCAIILHFRPCLPVGNVSAAYSRVVGSLASATNISTSALKVDTAHPSLSRTRFHPGCQPLFQSIQRHQEVRQCASHTKYQLGRWSHLWIPCPNWEVSSIQWPNVGQLKCPVCGCVCPELLYNNWNGGQLKCPHLWKCPYRLVTTLKFSHRTP